MCMLAAQAFRLRFLNRPLILLCGAAQVCLWKGSLRLSDFMQCGGNWTVVKHDCNLFVGTRLDMVQR